MQPSVAMLIEEVAGLSPGLGAARDDAARSVAPDEASAALVMLALGHQLADEIDGFDEAKRDAAFDAIERWLTDDDADVSAAAGALIEAMVGRAVDRGTWPALRAMFRDRSAAHALDAMALDR